MKVLAALLALLLIASPLTASKPKFLDAVRPLAMDGELGAPTNMCTASYINKKDRLWLTAAHCIDGPIPYYIDGLVVIPILRDVVQDLAILLSPLPGGPQPSVALKLAARGPDFGDEVLVGGHPFGYDSLFLTKGFVANPKANIGDARPYMMLDVAGAPGNSGSPIVNKKGEVVSVLQVGYGRTFGPMVGGATHSMLLAYKAYFE